MLINERGKHIDTEYINKIFTDKVFNLFPEHLTEKKQTIFPNLNPTDWTAEHNPGSNYVPLINMF